MAVPIFYVGGKVSKDEYSKNLAEELNNPGVYHMDISWPEDKKQPQKLLLTFQFKVVAPNTTNPLGLNEKIFMRLDYSDNTNDKIYFPCRLEPLSWRTTSNGYTYVEEELELDSDKTLFNISINKSGGASVLLENIDLRASYGGTMMETGTSDYSSGGVDFAFERAYNDPPTVSAGIIGDSSITDASQLICEPYQNIDGKWVGVKVRAAGGGAITSGAKVSIQAHCTGLNE